MTTKVLPVVDLQLGRDLEKDPFESFEQYRDEYPFWSESGDFYESGFWVISKYEHCREILQDAEAFPSEVFGATQLLPTMAGPPELQNLRRVVLPHVSRGRVLALEGSIRRLARFYINGFAESGSCNLVIDFARRYPIAVFSELFGLGADQGEVFRDLAEKFLHYYGEQRDRTWEAIRRLMQNELETRLTNPSDDLLTGIAQGTIEGQSIDMGTRINLASTVFLGGLDTLPSNLGWSFRYLATHPEARARLVSEPAIAAEMVEEFLRIYPVVAKERRLVGRDIHFHGAEMKAGDRVVALMSLANRDEEKFHDGRSVNFDRVSRPHLTFGVGPHRCLGSHLARHELAIALTEWHRRIPNYHIAKSANIRFNGGIFSVSSLPLEWDPASVMPAGNGDLA